MLRSCILLDNRFHLLTQLQQFVNLKLRDLPFRNLPLNNALVVILRQILKVYLIEPVQERLRESLSSSDRGGTLTGILTCEDEKVRMTLVLLVQLRDIDRASVVQNSVQAFQYALLSKVHLIYEEPVPLLDGLKKHTVTPMESDIVLFVLILLVVIVSVLHRVLASK